MKKTRLFTTKNLVRMALMASIASVLMYFEFPLPFLAPDFYRMDFSEVPVLVAGFMMGPLAAVCVELLKILIIFFIKGSYTAGVGELANFLTGCVLVLPPVLLMQRQPSKKRLVVGSVVGVLLLMLAAGLLNYFLLLPLYAKLLQVPLEVYIQAGAALNGHIVDLKGLIVLCVLPFNLVKGALVTTVAGILYARIGNQLKRY
ncbi:ECF transporter S component [Peptococcus simiae]|uniref:ECF transporter S component n=1 Tax=Peptococcus simiae TaxID=1643805 RepID=UPI0039811D68